jgi:hypothetical protein
LIHSFLIFTGGLGKRHSVELTVLLFGTCANTVISAFIKIT